MRRKKFRNSRPLHMMDTFPVPSAILRSGPLSLPAPLYKGKYSVDMQNAVIAQQNSERALITIEEGINTYSEEIDQQQELANTPIPQNLPEVFVDILASNQRRAHTSIMHLEARRLDGKNSRINAIAEIDLAIKNQSYFSPKCKVITSRDIVRTIRQHPMVSKTAKIRFYDNYVIFRTIPILLQPNSNPYKWINNGGPVVVKLAPMIIRVHTKTMEIRIQAAEHGGWRSNSHWDYAPHPHVLNNGKPCFGDFGPPIAETIAEGDFALMLDVLYAFLRTADSGDSAGKHWPMFLLPANWQRDSRMFSSTERLTHESVLINGTEYTLQVDDNGAVTYTPWEWRIPQNILPGVFPERPFLKFWDGTSLIETGDIVILNGTYPRCVAVDNKGTIFYAEQNDHPAITPRSQWKAIDGNIRVSSLINMANKKEICARYINDVWRRLHETEKLRATAQQRWNQWFHTTPQRPSWNPGLVEVHSVGNSLLVMKVLKSISVRTQGPGSRLLHKLPGETLRLAHDYDWSKFHVEQTVEPVLLPPTTEPPATELHVIVGQEPYSLRAWNGTSPLQANDVVCWRTNPTIEGFCVIAPPGEEDRTNSVRILRDGTLPWGIALTAAAPRDGFITPPQELLEEYWHQVTLQALMANNAAQRREATDATQEPAPQPEENLISRAQARMDAAQAHLVYLTALRDNGGEPVIITPMDVDILGRGGIPAPEWCEVW